MTCQQSKHCRLSLEPLESRDLLALTVTIDYSYDSNNFFDTAAKRDLLQSAADAIVAKFGDDLDAITPSGGNTWTAAFDNPATGHIAYVSDLNVGADEIIVYAGGRDLGESLGEGGSGSFTAAGSASWLDTVQTRGEAGAGEPVPTDFGPWGGGIAFNTTANWHFGTTTAGLGEFDFDFYSTALHELSHLLGFGTANSWFALATYDGVGGLEFTGANSVEEYDGVGNIPLTNSAEHWASGTTDDGQIAAMDPSSAQGIRKDLTLLDWAALDDIGWDELHEDAEVKVFASDYALSDWFGSAVDIDSDWAVVGAIREDTADTDAGAVYIYKLETGSWVEKAKITASDGAAYDQFGVSVAISNDTIVVGSWLANSNGSNSGAAYVYQRDYGGIENWGEVAKLVGSGVTPADYFGADVGIDGDTIVVGAYYDDSVDTRAGAAYVFERDQGGTDNWGEVKQLSGSDTVIKDNFGFSVAVDGDTIVVGAKRVDVSSNTDAGAAYVFGRHQGGSNNWGELKKVVASDEDAGDQFGSDVAISGTTIAVGARLDDDVRRSSGSAYVFEKDQGGSNNWGEVVKLTAASNAGLGAWFGSSLSMDGDTLLIGAKYEKSGSSTQVGAAYEFGRDEGGTGNWGEVQRIVASDANNRDRFGFGVAVSGTRGLIGAQLEDPGATNAGSAYVVRLTGAAAASAPPPPAANLPEPEANHVEIPRPTNQAPGEYSRGGAACGVCPPQSDVILVQAGNDAPNLPREIAKELPAEGMCNDLRGLPEPSQFVAPLDFVYTKSRMYVHRHFHVARCGQSDTTIQFAGAIDGAFADFSADFYLDS